MEQPWLQDRDPAARRVADDFSRRTATLPLGRALIVLGLAGLLLLAGRSEQMVDAAYGLPLLPGTETLIALTEAWHEAMSGLGVPQAMDALRGWLSIGR